MIWHNAALVRVDKMPPLTDLTGDKKEQVQGIDEDAILAGLKRFAVDGGKNGG